MVCGLICKGKQRSQQLFYFAAGEESVCERKKIGTVDPRFNEHCSELDVKTTLTLQKLSLGKLMDIKNEGCKCYLGNKEQKIMFSIVSIGHAIFFFLFFFCFLRARLGA